jgi:hypothetical protein
MAPSVGIRATALPCPLAMAVALGGVVLLAWALAPFGWRSH